MDLRALHGIDHADVFEPAFVLRRAPSPVGPYSAPRLLFRALAPETFFIGVGGEHASLRPSAAALAITYTTRTRDAATSGLHLVTLEVLGK